MIAIKLKGRFGNQLFQYATCRSIAEKCGYDYNIIIGSSNLEVNRLKLPMGQKVEKTVHQLRCDYCAKYLYENNELPKEYLEILDNTELIGWFQHFEFFDFNYGNIIKWFDVTKIIDDSLYADLAYKYNNHCFIHIRGGDYIQEGYELPKSYFIKSMDIISNIVNDIKYIILTDDVNYSKRLFPNIDSLSNDDCLIDFKLLQSAKYLISSNSTFSWWSAYLNETAEKIIYPFGGLFYGKDTQDFSRCNKFYYV